MTLDEFFDGYDQSRPIFERVAGEVERLGHVELKITKSQIAFRRRRPFAWVWIPGRYLHGRSAPLVLSIVLRRRDLSPRWKEIIEPALGRFMHHLELYAAHDIDAEVVERLREAWLDAAQTKEGST